MTDAVALFCTALVIYGAIMTLAALRLRLKVTLLRIDIHRLLFEPGYYDKVQEEWRVFNAKWEAKEKASKAKQDPGN